MAEEARERWLARIHANIATHGHHLTVVQGGPCPRWAYSIGLRERLGQELVLAGGGALSYDEAAHALNHAATELRRGPAEAVEVDGVGSFGLRPVERSWTGRLLLGAIDVAGTDDVGAVQLVPLAELETVDVPDLTEPFDPAREPVWRWLDEPWDVPGVPQDATAVTNLDALRGHAVTEAARWEPDQWEIFSGAGPEVPREEIRIVPLWTLVGADPTARPVADLAVGEAIGREWPGEWETWGGAAP